LFRPGVLFPTVPPPRGGGPDTAPWWGAKTTGPVFPRVSPADHTFYQRGVGVFVNGRFFHDLTRPGSTRRGLEGGGAHPFFWGGAPPPARRSPILGKPIGGGAKFQQRRPRPGAPSVQDGTDQPGNPGRKTSTGNRGGGGKKQNRLPINPVRSRRAGPGLVVWAFQKNSVLFQGRLFPPPDTRGGGPGRLAAGGQGPSLWDPVEACGPKVFFFGRHNFPRKTVFCSHPFFFPGPRGPGGTKKKGGLRGPTFSLLAAGGPEKAPFLVAGGAGFLTRRGTFPKNRSWGTQGFFCGSRGEAPFPIGGFCSSRDGPWGGGGRPANGVFGGALAPSR